MKKPRRTDPAGRIALSLACLLAASLSTGEPARSVLIISSSDIQPYREAVDGFMEVMRRQGAWKAARRTLEDGSEGPLLPGADLILAVGTPALKRAKAIAGGTPVVFSMVSHPGPAHEKDVAGVTIDVPFEAKLRAMKRILPGGRKVGILYSSDSAALYREASRSASALGLKVVGKEVPREKDFPRAVQELLPRADFFLMLPDPRLYSIESTKYLLLESLRRGVPVIGLSAAYCKGGALISLECDYRDVGRQTGELALRILGGEPARTEGSAAARTFDISVNVAVAERLNLKIPPDLMADASAVYGS